VTIHKTQVFKALPVGDGSSNAEILLVGLMDLSEEVIMLAYFEVE